MNRSSSTSHYFSFPPRSSSAYTLLEVMLAMGIFVIGFVAVASIFPAAAILQKATIEDAISQQFVRSATATLQGRQLQVSDLDSIAVPAPTASDPQPQYDVYTVPTALLAAPRWTISDRSSLSTVTRLESRSYYWVPLVRRKSYTAVVTPPTPHTPASDWQVFLFCLKREDNTTYARPAPTTSWANPNDYIPANFYSAGDPSADLYAIPGVFNVAVAVSSSDQTRFNFSSAGFNADTNADGRPDEIATGDQVLDNNGTIYTVTAADANGINIKGFIYPSQDSGAYPTSLWYGRPGTSTTGTGRTTSPTHQLVLIENAVK